MENQNDNIPEETQDSQQTYNSADINGQQYTDPNAGQQPYQNPQYQNQQYQYTNQNNDYNQYQSGYNYNQNRIIITINRMVIIIRIIIVIIQEPIIRHMNRVWIIVP